MLSYSLGGASERGLELFPVQRKCPPPSRQKAAPLGAQVLTKCPSFPSLRVETKLQTVEAQFTAVDSSLQELAQKFELLEKELGQDALGER